MRKQNTKRLIKVGTFISFLTLLMMIALFSIGKERNVFASKIDIRARVATVANLKPGSYVELKGIRIGTVKEAKIISDHQIEITITITEDMLQWIKKDSKVAINTAGLVGDKYLEVFGGSKDAGKFDPEKDFLTADTQLDFSKIMHRGESIAEKVDRILDKFDMILTHMDDGKNIVSTINSLQATAHKLNLITQEISPAKVKEGMNSFTSSMGRLDRITKQVENGPGSVHSLLYDDGVHDDLRTLLGGAERNKVIKYVIRESIKNSESKKPKAQDK